MTARTSARHHRGFTLAELVIVVVIISVVAAIVVPALLSLTEEAPSGLDEEEAATAPHEESSPVPDPRGAWPPPDATAPRLERAIVQADVDARHALDGVTVHAHYEASVEGRFRVTRPGGRGRVWLEFPFPGETTGAQGVSLVRRLPGGETVELEGVVYRPDGIRWVGEIGPDPISLEVLYEVRGRDRFVYRLPGRGRAGHLDLELRVSGVEEAVVPPDVLQPTRSGDTSFRWEFRDLVTDRPVVVDLPATTSPLGRVILLCQLAGLAVLLFGAGFWYLSELREPGALDDFRLGDFLLLALTYSLFFVVFAVLAFRTERIVVPLCVAAVIALPLLVLHLSRVLDLAFALGRVLPLAAGTLLLVVNGVYGGELRDYVFVGAAVLAIGGITITYRRFAAGRRERREARRAERDREDREGEVDRRLADLDPVVARARALRSEADRLGEAEAAEGVPDELTDARDAVDRVLATLDLHREAREALPEEDGAAHAGACQVLGEEVERTGARLQPTVSDLEAALARRRASAARRAADVAGAGTVHCLACGRSGPRSPHCPECGTPRPVERTCSSCGEVLALPVHLVDEEKGPEPLHCPACGSSMGPVRPGHEPS